MGQNEAVQACLWRGRSPRLFSASSRHDVNGYFLVDLSERKHLQSLRTRARRTTHEATFNLVKRPAITLYLTLNCATAWGYVFNSAPLFMDRLPFFKKYAAPTSRLKSLI
jgi:hypothetical protein